MKQQHALLVLRVRLQQTHVFPRSVGRQMKWVEKGEGGEGMLPGLWMGKVRFAANTKDGRGRGGGKVNYRVVPGFIQVSDPKSQ